MFDDLAPVYDPLNRLLSFGMDVVWRRRMVRMVAACNPSRIVDVATGTADLAIGMARRTAASVTGCDLSRGMLEVGRRKVTAAALDSRIELVVDDAENSALDSDIADCVTVCFGIRNFRDKLSALKHMHRVLRSGGRCMVMEFSVPRGRLFGSLYRFYFHRILPAAGGLLSGRRKSYDYLPRSVDGFPEPRQFEELMRRAGFSQVSSRPLTFGVAYIYTGIKR